MCTTLSQSITLTHSQTQVSSQNDLLKSLLSKDTSTSSSQQKESSSSPLSPQSANSILMSALKLPSQQQSPSQQQPTPTTSTSILQSALKLDEKNVSEEKDSIKISGKAVTTKVLDHTPGFVTPSVSNITFYKSKPSRTRGRGVAVSSKFICYGLKKGKIRIISQVCAQFRGLVSGHENVKDMVFSPHSSNLLASLGTEGNLCVWRIGT